MKKRAENPTTINRTVILVIPKKLFYEWEKAVFPDMKSIEESASEYSSYLIESGVFPEEPKAVLEEDWQWIFENELFGICIDEEFWPQKRSWTMFTEWFDIKFCTHVIDLLEGPVVHNDY
ncbi:MAG TPA: hypothetical protein DIW47_11895 [Bacteroidetes bacterium]|nr:hypothetical protein [Bacteroidota bacterium]